MPCASEYVHLYHDAEAVLSQAASAVHPHEGLAAWRLVQYKTSTLMEHYADLRDDIPLLRVIGRYFGSFPQSHYDGTTSV